MKERYQVTIAKVVSLVCEPYYLPLVVYLVLLTFSYLKLLPLDYKLMLMGWILLFTVAIPVTLLWIYRTLPWRKTCGVGEIKLVGYVVFMLSYTACLFLMRHNMMPQILQRVMFASLIIQLACFALNFFLRISAHSAAAGGLVGALIAFSIIFGFDPTRYLCILIVFAGLVGTSRLVLRRHTLVEVNLGLVVGFVCSLWAILVW